MNPLGYFPKDAEDVVPTALTVFSNKITQVRDPASFRSLTQLGKRTLEGMTKLRRRDGDIPLGRPLTTAEAEERTGVIYIPDDDSSPPPFVRSLTTDVIQSNGPEEEARKRVDVLNEIEFSDEELVNLKTTIGDLTESSKTLLLTQCVAPFMAFDNASSMASAIMRDSMGVPVEIDTGAVSALSHLTKLAIISHYAKDLPIPEEIKTRYLEELATLMATESITDMRKQSTGEKYSAMLRNLHAKSQETVDAASNPMGAIRRRSGSPKANSTEN